MPLSMLGDEFLMNCFAYVLHVNHCGLFGGFCLWKDFGRRSLVERRSIPSFLTDLRIRRK